MTENSLPSGQPEYTIWCSGCSSEPAIELMEVEWSDEWVSFPIGQDCLTRVQENGKID